LLFVGQNIKNKKFELKKTYVNEISLAASSLGNIIQNISFFREFDSLPQIRFFQDTIFIQEYTDTSIKSLFLSFSGVVLSPPEEAPVRLEERFEIKDDTLYKIHADTSPLSQKFLITRISKNQENEIVFELTNVLSENYISDFTPDHNNPPYIKAIKVHNSASDVIGKWICLDEKYGRNVALLRKTIEENHPELSSYPWEFLSLYVPEIQGTYDISQSQGSLGFSQHLCIDSKKRIRRPYFSGGRIVGFNDFTMCTFSPQMITTHDSKGYPIHYGLFRANDKPAPTLMLIDGGPDNFVDFQDYHKEISFFNQRGYHVVIPEGLFREGYPVSHYQISQGEWGLRDIEQLRNVIEDLLRQGISDDKIYIKGHSYGGFCAARLANDSALVKAAIIEAAALDLMSYCLRIADIKRFIKPFSDVDEFRKHVRSISPALDAPLPSVPVFVRCAANDVRCPLGDTRKFVKRLLFEQPNHELIYLESSGKGHGNQFENLEVILDFFQNVRGKHCLQDIEGHELVNDTMDFFRK
jgi:dienelactone hydrolase